jgi:hypothetical protein
MAYLISSYEHAAWWRPHECGYTKHRHQAGRYTEERAIEICRNANLGCRDGDVPQEAMVPEPPTSP